MKKTYEEAKLEVITLSNDVIVTSGGHDYGGEDDELP